MNVAVVLGMMIMSIDYAGVDENYRNLYVKTFVASMSFSDWFSSAIKTPSELAKQLENLK